MGQIWGFQAFLKEHMEGLAWNLILHADVCWPPAELIRLWLCSVDVCNFGAILT